jgi:hypothetical protein
MPPDPVRRGNCWQVSRNPIQSQRREPEHQGTNRVGAQTFKSVQFGDAFLTQDLRLSRDFALREHWRMTLIGDVFNVFNLGNLAGRTGDLLGAGFGQPTSRVTPVFGSGGPRAFQIAARMSF